jgi:hypothetical protein
LNRIYEVHVVRHIWNEVRILEEWKETALVPIRRKGDRDGCENYRGKALGNAVYKTLSNIILGKIKPYIEKIKGNF